MELLQEISASLQRGDSVKVSELTKKAIDKKLEPKAVLDQGLIAGMAVIGEKFKAHEIFLPDVLLAAKAMYTGMDILRPLFIDEEMPSIGKVVIGTVQGDMHDIGKNLVKMMLEGAGFETVDLGTDVEPQAFVDAVREHQPQMVGMSALLTTTMVQMGT
ncbi:MAG: cobalamin-dependent protein, partial [candidate division Zixibacteria bacterium]|nr:cobalamin-dependent protein [candidate division Zixibacteria bacterium]